MNVVWVLPQRERWLVVWFHDGRVQCRETSVVDASPASDSENVAVDPNPDPHRTGHAVEVAGLLHENGLSDRSVVLGLDWQWIHTRWLADAAATRSQAERLYALESSLPFDVEDTAAAFVEHRDGVMAIAAEAAPIRSVLTPLGEAGVEVEHILPTPIAIAEAVATEASVVWLRGSNLLQQIVLDPHRTIGPTVTAWRVSPATEPALRWTFGDDPLRGEIKHVALRDERSLSGQPFPIRGVGRTDRMEPFPQTDSVAEAEKTDFFSAFDPMLSVEEAWKAWFESPESQAFRWDLRVGPLASDRRLGQAEAPMQRAALAILLMVGVAIAAMLIRRGRIESALETVRADQTRIVRQEFPGRGTVTAPLRLVRSQYSKAIASRGGGSDLPETVDAMRSVASLLSAIPEDIRFQLQSIEARSGDITLDGVVRQNVHAGRIAAAIEDAGFRVQPPRVDQTEDGYAVRILSERRPIETDNRDSADRSSNRREPRFAVATASPQSQP